MPSNFSVGSNGVWHVNGKPMPNARVVVPETMGGLFGTTQFTQYNPEKHKQGYSPSNPEKSYIQGMELTSYYHPEQVTGPDGKKYWLELGKTPGAVAPVTYPAGGSGTGGSNSLLDSLDNSFNKRLAAAQAARNQDRILGAARGQEMFYEGSLGRVSEELDPDFMMLLSKRVNDANTLNLSDEIGKQRDNLSRTEADFQKAIDSRQMNSAEMQAARESGALNINRALMGEKRQANASAQEGGIMGGAQARAKESEAVRNFGLARGQLERDLILGNLDAREMLMRDQANARAANINQLANLRIGEAQMMDTLSQRADALVLAAQDERLRRQLINLENYRSERYGAYGIEEAYVQSGIAERGGLRQELVAEAGQAESARHAREMEEIQRIEAEKDPPSAGGGGKSIMCIVMWKHGFISDAVLAGDFAYCAKHIDSTTRAGYLWSSSWIADQCIKQGPNGFITRMFKPLVVGWANEMAWREGVDGAYSNWIGRWMCRLGVPMCRAFGWIAQRVESLADTESRVAPIFDMARHLMGRNTSEGVNVSARNKADLQRIVDIGEELKVKSQEC